ncbi:MAG: hypothetical protein HXS48_01980 [Theionarchaea archaeon]|nr:hypothetical protein [Theionarchaea archaeon]
MKVHEESHKPFLKIPAVRRIVDLLYLTRTGFNPVNGVLFHCRDSVVTDMLLFEGSSSNSWMRVDKKDILTGFFIPNFKVRKNSFSGIFQNI